MPRKGDTSMSKLRIEDIDWETYKEDVAAAMRNERLWAMGAERPEEEMHLANYDKLQEELRLLEAGDYAAVLEANPEPDIFSDYLKSNG